MIAFFLVMFIYGSIGGFGSLGLVGITPYKQNPVYIYDYFSPADIAPFLISFFFFLHLASVYPLFIFISKNSFFPVIYKDEAPPFKSVVIFNSIFGIICLII